MIIVTLDLDSIAGTMKIKLFPLLVSRIITSRVSFIAANRIASSYYIV
jgi:hypothetical protein